MSQVESVSRGRSRAAGLLLCAAWAATSLSAQDSPPASAAPEASAAPSTPARLRPARVPAAGRQVAELDIAEFGRYSIRTTSARGTSLQVLDRMSGTGEVHGEAGKSDGRIDLFLDRGTVRLLTSGSPLASGEATLEVLPFLERAGAAATAVQLVEGRAIDGELADLEQISWWIEIPKRRRVVFEAAGRNLADLRLWQNGSWLVDAAPTTSVVEPQVGRPLQLCQLTADLAPGLYRLTAYGGPEIRWAASGVERPFHLRFGWTRDAQTLRERRTIGPLGFDRVLVSGVADYFRLELPEPPAGEATVDLELVTFDEQDPFATGGPATSITKENLPPVGELRVDAEPERSTLVTVRGAAGQPYVLQHFARTRERELNARSVKSEYWISTVHAGPVADAIEPTAILVRKGDGAKRKSEVLASETVRLTQVEGWARRFNLLEAATLFVRVDEAATYVVQSRGTAAQFRFEPLFIDAYPEGWQQPPMRSAPAEWQLDPGFYVFFLQPVEPGIAELEIAAKGAPSVPVEPSRPSVQLGVQTLNAKLGYHLYLSQQPGVEAGMVVRELPLDLAAALPLALGPGEEIELAVRAAERSSVRALTEEGGTLEVSVDGGEWSGRAVGSPASFVEAGEHRLRVRSTADRSVLASVGLVAESQLASTPLPAVPQASFDALPEFPRLGGDARPAFDLATGEARTFLVAADEPALYRIESTGLLATGGALRTRTRANLFSQAENGVGRNFALAAYLREGDYQLTVRPRGASAGHLGLEMARAPIEDAGTLTEGVPARATIDPRSALAYRFAVAEAGRFTISAWGLKSSFQVRLEDEGGWPVGAPLATGDVTLDLEQGSYRLIVLPQAVPARAIVVVSRRVEPRELEGHGPHELALDREASHLWLEPEGEAPRTPDRWRFRLPAATGVTVSLSDEMMGVVSRVPSPGANGAAPLPDGGLVPPGRSYRAELPAGTYELVAESSRRNNRNSYRVSVKADDLVDGGARLVRAPGEISVSVGTAAQIELASFGRVDVRARLLTAEGAPIASADDRPGDWNFLLAERLAAGRYRLQVEPVGVASATTLVAMRVLSERAAKPLEGGAPAARALYEVADDAELVPLARPDGAEIVAVGALGAESLGLALEERVDDAWRPRSSASGRALLLALPLAESTGELRLRIWSLDRRPTVAEVTFFAGAAEHRNENDLARGFELPPLPGLVPGMAVAIVDLAEPGCFRREGSAGSDLAAGLLQALAAGSTFERAAPTLAPVGFTMPIAAAVAEGGSAHVQARRARLGEGEPLALFLPADSAITCDVADGGAAVVELEAMAGEPAVGFLDGRGSVGPSTAWPATGGARVRTAAGAGKGRAVELWNGAQGRVEARLSGWLANSDSAVKLGWGNGSATAAAREVRLVELPAGEKEMRITLAEGSSLLALAPASRDSDADAEALVWAALEARTETLVSASTRLLLFGGESADGEASLELLPRRSAKPAPEAGENALTDHQRFERRFSSTGAFRLAVPGNSANSCCLHLRGAGAALFVGGDGRVQRGRDFELTSAGGSLRFEHPAGLVSAWIDDGNGPGASAQEMLASAPAATALTLPASVELAGEAMAFEVAVASPSLLELRGTGPLAVVVGSPSVRSEVYPDGARLDAVLTPGKTRLTLRGLAGESLTGSLTLVAEPLVPFGEGLGEEALLAAGDSRGYSFHVARSGPLGVGVRADRGGVESLLFDSSGRRLGQGVVQWVDAAPGDYVLVLAAPAEGQPARVRPALVGAAPPGSGPPPEEARRFLALAAGEVPAVAGIAGVEDLPTDWLGVAAANQGESYGDGEEYGAADDEAAYEGDEGIDEGEWDEESESGDDSGEEK